MSSLPCLTHVLSQFIWCKMDLGMGDAEYAGVFSHLVLPVLYNYKPDLIIIACGLDAVKGDLIGDCGLSSDMFYTMTRSLLEAAPVTPIVMALEGGYNVNKSAECMEKVALALLDEPLDSEKRKKYIVWTSKVSTCCVSTGGKIP